jgi:hypothetical protein
MLRVLKPTGKLILADFSMSGFRIMDAIHREEGRRHPHPPSRFTHWQARLHLAGFGTHRYTAWHQDLLVAGPRLGAMVVCGPVPDPDHAHRAKP